MRLHVAASAFAFVVLGLPLSASAQSVEPTPAQAARLYDSLARTINRGADVFNDEADYAGCYHLFEGALISIKPFASAERQKDIDDALAKSARMARFEDKAYRLRGALDVVREEFRRMAGGKSGTAAKEEAKKETKPAPTLKAEEKKPATETKTEKKPPDTKKAADAPKANPIPLPEKIEEKTKSSQAAPGVERIPGVVPFEFSTVAIARLQETTRVPRLREHTLPAA